jgi:phage FluMu protein Com
MRPPDSQQVFLKWMEWQGWEVKASAPGRLATQLLRQLGGVHGIGQIAQKRLLQMMGRMAGSYLSSDEVKGEASRTINERGLGSRSHLIKRLIESGIMRLGLEIQCPTCTQRSWHSLSDINYELRCPKCEDQFVVPSEAPEEMHWAYRARGAFDIPKQAHGVYCVLLVARFFSQVMGLPTTPVFGFEATNGKCKIEVDYGAITTYRSIMEDRRAVIFAECKTFNSFCPTDVRRMAVLERVFNEAVLVFATLKDSLTDKEQRALIALVKRCRRNQKANRKHLSSDSDWNGVVR